MDPKQELEWAKAQKIAISVDLVAAARRQLQLLSAIDKNRDLYDGPVLDRAIYRYNHCWLPFLARHSESEIPLVVPLDCEWIWHCHRLNPVQYKADCEELYGKILDNSRAVSSVQGICSKQTEEMWTQLYPDEPYNISLTNAATDDKIGNISKPAKCTKYDLVSAVRRQSPFSYQVSRPHMHNEIFLEEAVARYKGFLHLIKRNKEMDVKRFCVPTYDIDLIWHSHQLHPVAYCHDLSEALGKVLEHDDTDSDRTKGKKLDVGFSGTTKQWEETFGTRYWKAGAMYRGNAPSPITSTPCSFSLTTKETIISNGFPKETHFQERKVMEVFLEFIDVKYLPEGHKGSLSVMFSKSQPDAIFGVKRKLSILSESGEKQVASFQCEATGRLVFELISHPSNLPLTRVSKTLGTASISLQDYLFPVSKLSDEKWLQLQPKCGPLGAKPILLRVSFSFTVPVLAPYMFRLIQPPIFSKNLCLFSLPGRKHISKSWTRVMDEYENDTEVVSLQMRDLKAVDDSISQREVIGLVESGETRKLAEFVNDEWFLMNAQWSFRKISGDEGPLFELRGERMVKLFPGRKLEYETRLYTKHSNETEFLTAVEFCSENPYGIAVGLVDLKSGFIKAKEEWMVLPGVTLAFILSDMFKNHRVSYFAIKNKDSQLNRVTQTRDKLNTDDKNHNLASSEANGVELTKHVKNETSMVPQKNGLSSGRCDKGCDQGSGDPVKSGGRGAGSCSGYTGNMVTSASSGGCGGGGCGGSCGNTIQSGGCGSGCGGGCRNLIKGGGCGSGCGSGCGGDCGNLINGGGCGSGCGGGGCGGSCGNLIKSGGCGSGCGGGCGGGSGNLIKSGGCGGGCGGGGCGDLIESGSCGDCGGGGCGETSG